MFTCLCVVGLFNAGQTAVAAGDADLVPLQPTPTPKTKTPKEAIADEAEGLLVEGDNLKIQFNTAVLAQKDIDKEKADLDKTALLLAQAQKGNTAALNQWSIDAVDLAAAAEEHNKKKCTKKSDTDTSCDAYVKEADLGNKKAAELTQQKKDLDALKVSLAKQQQKLSDDTLAWFQKKKANDAILNDFKDKEAEYLDKIEVFRRKIQKFLVLHADANNDCEGLGDLEEAHQCMQSVWDAAQPPSKLPKLNKNPDR